ncbi:MAG: MraY family glycosyltransferase [Thermodesulfobacteriota bacterium]|nr:MraY family glycosyltransferase [Thermodesulfobacteriota bacterium]
MAIQLGKKAGILDKPDARKVHSAPIPRTGGVAIVLATFVPLFLGLSFTPLSLGYVFGAFCLVCFGVLDDFKPINYKIKLFGQIASCLIFLLVSGVRIQTFGEIFPGVTVNLGVLQLAVSVFFLLAVINIINLSDGLDGLAGGLSLLILLCAGFLSYAQGNVAALILVACVTGSLIGFLRYNIHPALVFMGDAGSQFLGYTIGVCMILLTQEHSIYSPVLPLFILGTPILDTALVIYERISAGKSPFHPDKNHIHHKLLKCGFEHEQAVIFMYLLHFLLILIGWSIRFAHDYVLFGIYLGILCIVFIFRILSKRTDNIITILFNFAPRAINSFCSFTNISLSRKFISRIAWMLFFVLFAIYYTIAPFYFIDTKWNASIICMFPLVICILIYKFRKNLFDDFLRISFYVLTLFLVINTKDYSVLIPLWLYQIDLINIVFFSLAVLYFACLILTTEKVPLNSIDYLLIGLVAFILFIPIRNEGFIVIRRIIYETVLIGLAINFIFSRIQRNRRFMFSILSYSSIAVFVLSIVSK